MAEQNTSTLERVAAWSAGVILLAFVGYWCWQIYDVLLVMIAANWEGI